MTFYTQRGKIDVAYTHIGARFLSESAVCSYLQINSFVGTVPLISNAKASRVCKQQTAASKGHFVMQKKCSNCQKTKPIADFYPRKISKDGYRGTCKTCADGQAARYRAGNKSKQTREKYYEENKEQIGQRNLNRYHEKYAKNLKKRLAVLENETRPGEVWKDIDSYEGFYQVSNMGNVRRIAPGYSVTIGAELSPTPNHDGYLQVNLSKYSIQKVKAIHRLVARAFLGPKPPGLEINHKNGIKADNRPDNLEYVTHAENMHHAKAIGAFDNHPKGSKHRGSVLTEALVLEMRTKYRNGQPIASIAREYNLVDGTARKAITGETWGHVK